MDANTATPAPSAKESKIKSWMYWALAITASVLIGMLICYPIIDSARTESAMLADSIATVDSINKAKLVAANKATAEAQKELANANNIIDEYSAEGEENQLIADSLTAQIAEKDSLLKVAQSALASCKKPATGKNAKPAANAVAAGSLKPSKGKPITNDTDKTFTVLNSDSALIVNAPTGYKVIRKPR